MAARRRDWGPAATGRVRLFSMGGLFARYEAWDKFQHPHAHDGIWDAIGTGMIGLLLVAICARQFPLPGS